MNPAAVDLRHGELTVGELARAQRRARLDHPVLRARGLIPSRHTSGNQRRYSRDALRRIAFVRASQRIRIRLSDIRDALSLLPCGLTPTREDRARVSGRRHDELTLRIELLLKLRDKTPTASAAAVLPSRAAPWSTRAILATCGPDGLLRETAYEPPAVRDAS